MITITQLQFGLFILAVTLVAMACLIYGNWKQKQLDKEEDFQAQCRWEQLQIDKAKELTRSQLQSMGKPYGYPGKVVPPSSEPIGEPADNGEDGVDEAILKAFQDGYSQGYAQGFDDREETLVDDGTLARGIARNDDGSLTGYSIDDGTLTRGIARNEGSGFTGWGMKGAPADKGPSATFNELEAEAASDGGTIEVISREGKPTAVRKRGGKSPRLVLFPEKD